MLFMKKYFLFLRTLERSEESIRSHGYEILRCAQDDKIAEFSHFCALWLRINSMKGSESVLSKAKEWHIIAILYKKMQKSRK